MSLILRLALASLRSRKLTTGLTVASIALSVTLLVGIETVRAGVRESFAGTIRGVDLIVGARGGTLQILLSSVFGIGSPAGSVKLSTMQRWAEHPAVKWVVPYSLGDSHRGFRVIGTTPEFFERYRYRQNASLTFTAGGPAVGDTDVVIGYDVAQRLGYAVGTPVVVVHGLQDIGTSSHDAHPFKVVGILARTFTPIDRSVYVTLEGIEAMHEEEQPTAGAGTAEGIEPEAKGAGAKGGETVAATSAKTPPPTVMPGAEPPPGTPTVMPGAEPPPEVKQAPRPVPKPKPAATDTAEAEHDHGDDQITAFFVGTKNRFEALMLQREMNTDLVEPLTAVIPGVALGELWQNIGNAEVGLRIIAMFAVAISITGMLVSLYSSLEARRREMAILRAIGAGPRTILSLLVLESTLLAFLGCVIGVALVYAGLALAQGPVEQRFGLHLALRALGSTEYLYLGIVMGAGMLIGFVPAWKAYRTSLVDGLSPRQ
ncbi:MAG: ABC transporter permease [Gemmatimonadaceae bacterium]|nr:ABC transporter permease [Gemmatimonadaceae bacterium]